MVLQCDNVSNRVGETSTIVGCIISLNSTSTSYAQINITYPWGTNEVLNVPLNNKQTITHTTGEYVEITLTSQITNIIAYFTVCYEGEPVEPTGELLCTTFPNEAEVWINDENTGETTPAHFVLMKTGNYSVVFKKEEYNNCSLSVEILEDQVVYADCDLVKTIQTGSLDCITYPSEATIYLNETDYGLTNKIITDLDSGDYTLKFIKDGYLEYETTITIETDKTTYIERALVEICVQNIEIQDQNYMPVEGVNVTINDVSKITDINGMVSFNLSFYEEYTVYKSYGEYTGNDIIEGCKLDPQILHIVIPEKPKCIDYVTQQECEDNGCYWWTSNNTCQNAPDGTTDYFDIHIKPYSWYEGKYEEALNSALALTVNLTGKITNYISSITGYEYTGLEIKEDVNKNVIIIRIFLKDTAATALVAPLIIVGLAAVVGSILIGIGYVIGTSQGGFSKSDITQLAEDIVRNAEIDAYEHAYNIDKTTATQLMDCLKTIETCDDSLTCFDNSGVTPSIANQLEVLVAYKTTIDAVYTGVADTVEDPEFEVFAAAALANLEIVIQKLNSATITPEGAACETTDIIDNTIDDLDEKQEEQELDDCVFDITGQCIVTTGALQAAILVGAGILGLIVYSATKK